MQFWKFEGNKQISVQCKITMRNIFYVITLFALLSSCSTTTEDNSVDLHNSDTSSLDVLEVKPTNDCDFIYDTIKNEKYRMHLVILDKFNHKEKRGYFFTAEGDTLNNFLYHQDIAAFANGLDSTETGLYKRLTNKVIFLILEHEPKMLDYGLTQWTNDLNDLNYFMFHVSHPICNTISLDSLKTIIKTETGEPHEGAKKVKRLILSKLDSVTK